MSEYCCDYKWNGMGAEVMHGPADGSLDLPSDLAPWAFADRGSLKVCLNYIYLEDGELESAELAISLEDILADMLDKLGDRWTIDKEDADKDMSEAISSLERCISMIKERQDA